MCTKITLNMELQKNEDQGVHLLANIKIIPNLSYKKEKETINKTLLFFQQGACGIYVSSFPNTCTRTMPSTLELSRAVEGWPNTRERKW